MPYSCDLDELPLVIDAVNSPVRSDDDLTDSWDTILEDNSAKLWKVFQLVGLYD